MSKYILMILAALSVTVMAQEESEETIEQSNEQANDQGVLDFEGDVIEGQRKRPDLFVQSEIRGVTLDAILYLRKDFNDFHQAERARQPGYFKRKNQRRP